MGAAAQTSERFMSTTQLSIPHWGNPVLQTVRDKWGWILAMGIFLILSGIFAISFPLASSMAIALFVGWVLIFCGGFRCIHSFMAREWAGGLSEFLLGILQVIGGGLILGDVFVGLAAITIILAIAILLGGLTRTMVAIKIKPAKGWGWMLFGGGVSILLSLFLFSNLVAASLVMLGTILGIYLIFDGWAAIALALVARQAKQEMGRLESGAGNI